LAKSTLLMPGVRPIWSSPPPFPPDTARADDESREVRIDRKTKPPDFPEHAVVFTQLQMGSPPRPPPSLRKHPPERVLKIVLLKERMTALRAQCGLSSLLRRALMRSFFVSLLSDPFPPSIYRRARFLKRPGTDGIFHDSDDSFPPEKSRTTSPSGYVLFLLSFSTRVHELPPRRKCVPFLSGSGRRSHSLAGWWILGVFFFFAARQSFLTVTFTKVKMTPATIRRQMFFPPARRVLTLYNHARILPFTVFTPPLLAIRSLFPPI